jgi:hypothetical protein
MLKNGLFKILFASVIIFAFVQYVSAGISVGGDATQGIDIKMINYVNNPPGVDGETEFKFDLSASFSVNFDGENVSAKAGFKAGGFKDLWGKLLIDDNMSVLVGRTTAPFSLSSNGALCGGDVGNPGVGRFDMILFQAGNFQIAALNAEPKLENLKNLTPTNTLEDIAEAKNKNILPRFEAILEQSIENKFNFAIGGGFQTFKFEYGKDSDSSINVNSYIVGLELEGMLGPVTITGRGTYGSNLGLYLSGGIGGYNDRKPVFELATEKLRNNTSVSTFGGIKIKATDAITLGAGYGFTTQIHEVKAYDKADPAQYMFTNCEFVILEHLIIFPEVGYLYELQDYADNDENSTIIFHTNVKVSF